MILILILSRAALFLFFKTRCPWRQPLGPTAWGQGRAGESCEKSRRYFGITNLTIEPIAFLILFIYFKKGKGGRVKNTISFQTIIFKLKLIKMNQRGIEPLSNNAYFVSRSAFKKGDCNLKRLRQNSFAFWTLIRLPN